MAGLRGDQEEAAVCICSRAAFFTLIPDADSFPPPQSGRYELLNPGYIASPFQSFHAPKNWLAFAISRLMVSMWAWLRGLKMTGNFLGVWAIPSW